MADSHGQSLSPTQEALVQRSRSGSSDLGVTHFSYLEASWVANVLGWREKGCQATSKLPQDTMDTETFKFLRQV